MKMKRTRKSHTAGRQQQQQKNLVKEAGGGTMTRTKTRTMKIGDEEEGRRESAVEETSTMRRKIFEKVLQGPREVEVVETMVMAGKIVEARALQKSRGKRQSESEHLLLPCH